MNFEDWASVPDERLSVLTGALLVARDAYPALDVEAERQRVYDLADPLIALGLLREPTAAQAGALSGYLAGALGFRGNADDYHDADNSFLNRVLDRRLGLPITLSILYVEVGRRAGYGAHGVAFPGHFLVRLDDAGAEAPIILDPFHGGRRLGPEALRELLARHAAGRALTADLLEPAGPRAIVARLLANLRSLYARRGDFARLLLALDRSLALYPDATQERRDRGLLHARLGSPHAARADLEAYVERAPHAGDVAEIRSIIARLEREGGALQ
jgi:regulator of sirC expression with transglutaminase-like and TPR domain